MRTNRDVESGRVYIIILDDLNVAPLRTAIVRRQARDFIEKHFRSSDLAAVVSTSGRKDAAQEFTSDPALLLRAIDHFFGQRLQPAETQRLDDYYQNQLLAPLNDTVSVGNFIKLNKGLRRALTVSAYICHYLALGQTIDNR